jgi:hypothetical protein
MKTILKLATIIIVFFLHQSCNQSKAYDVNINPRNDYALINKEIKEKKLDSVSAENYTYWLKNKEIVKLYVFEGDGENYATHEEYYLKNKKVYAFQKKHIDFPNALDYKALLFFNNKEILEGDFWIENIKKEKTELLKLLEMHGLTFQNEIIIDKTSNNSKGLLTVDELSIRYGIHLQNSNTENRSNQTPVSNNRTFQEIQLELIDASLKKAKLYLGEPDVFESTFGHITKGFVVYYNKVDNNGNSPKHLVLFLRWKDGSNNPEIEELFSVSDYEQACFGVHCIEVREGEIYTNALDLIQDEGYKAI